jgi:hypothetical protein
MRSAKELRDTAWNALRGRYWWAVLATLVAGFLGGYTIGRPSFDFKFSGTDVHSIGEWFRQLPDMVSSMNFSNLTGVIRIPGVVAGSGLAHAFFGLMAVVASIAFTYGLAMFIIGGAIELGFDLFNVSLYTASGKPKFELLFSRFSIFGF